MKKILTISILLFTMGVSNPALAQGAGGSTIANSAGMMEGVNAGVNGALGAQNAAKCSPKNPYPCVVAALSFAQLAMSLMQMMGSMGGRDSLAPGADWSGDPGILVQETIPDGFDTGWLDPLKNPIESGKLNDYENAKIQMLNKAKPHLDKLEKAGYKVDMNTGMVTGPNGPVDGAGFNIADQGAAAYLESIGKSLGELDMSGGGGMIALDGGGVGAGGGYGRNVASDGSGSGGSGVDDFLSNLKKGDVDGSKLSGMSKNTADGDRIGVAMNNIFKMIQNKYTSIDRTKNEFLTK